MSKSIVTFLALFALWSFSVAQGDGDVAAGRILAERNCVYCHGPDGNGNKSNRDFQRGNVPRISGQPRFYFIKSMGAYKLGTRPDDDMNLVAEQLSDDEIRNLAAWYAAQPPSATATYDDEVFSN
jgi:cytochrome c553